MPGFVTDLESCSEEGMWVMGCNVGLAVLCKLESLCLLAVKLEVSVHHCSYLLKEMRRRRCDIAEFGFVSLYVQLCVVSIAVDNP